MHIGAFVFRDIFLPLRVLIGYGRAEINPMQGMRDVPENVLKWVFHKNETGNTLYDQWIDLYDFVYGLDDVSKLKNCSEQAIEWWLLAKQQLEGASATLLGSIDKYTIIQNSIIAMELFLKGALSGVCPIDSWRLKCGSFLGPVFSRIGLRTFNFKFKRRKLPWEEIITF